MKSLPTLNPLNCVDELRPIFNYITMKKRVFFVWGMFLSLMLQGQVAEMNWQIDYQIYLKLANDSNYVYDLADAFHITQNQESFTSEFVFYPVNPGQQFANDVSSRQYDTTGYTTLWSALHASIGLGWVHFVNCIAYALETGKLDLEEPILKRPETNWKPNPITESYKRTKKWEYYLPMNQKYAIKEYNLRAKNNELGDLKNMPDTYISTFLETSEKEYQKLKLAGETSKLARIDLVKVILGANYLGAAQIEYISHAVMKAIESYSLNRIPSVIIFDEFDAAVAMSLDDNGYAIETIVFKKSANLSDDEIFERKEKIQKMIATINTYNNKSFQRRLGNYYSD